MAVTQLGYLGFDVVDVDAWQALCTDILGFELRPREAQGPLYFRIDERHHRFALYPAKTDRLAYIGWEVGARSELARLAADLKEAGVKVETGTAEDCATRRVEALIKTEDPNGTPLELYFGPGIDERPFRPGRAITGFNTGLCGLGHLIMACSDYQKTVEFYMKVLGFKLSDYIVWDGAHATFLHCNPRHHSIAFIPEIFGMKGGEINHFMVETKSLDDVGRAYDMVQDQGIPLIFTLGRHTNDQMTSFYFKSPSGFAIEYGYGGVLINDAEWEVRRYGATMLWGHRSPAPAAE